MAARVSGRGLAHGDHMQCRGRGARMIVHQVQGVVLDVEAGPRGHRDVARIVPIGDVDFAIRQQRAHGRAQQSRVVARHRRHQQARGGPSRYASVRRSKWIRSPKGAFDHGFVFRSGDRARPSPVAPTIVAMPQSGRAVMRWKVRSVTSPQARHPYPARGLAS